MSHGVDHEGRVPDAPAPRGDAQGHLADRSPGRRRHADLSPGLDDEELLAPGGTGSTWPVALLSALVALTVGVLGTLWLTGSESSAPSDWGADAGFARDMQTHHQQAVEMSLIVYAKTTDPDVRTLAYDIATSQQQQSGQMYAWLRMWGLSQTGSRPPMAWVGAEHAKAHARADGTMPGMATPAQIAELQGATGPDADRLFLRLMIAHHEGGVAMADAAVAEATQPEVRSLASAISNAQTSEIALLRQMLAERS